MTNSKELIPRRPLKNEIAYKRLDKVYSELLSDYLLFKGTKERLEKKLIEAVLIQDDETFDKLMTEYGMLIEDCESM
ncbi:hypothetical protein [Niallia taxi]|uniref:hypothetical protein n=1 Tax=Niallia taxi TaxID=2499688 RepID=UPI0015F5568C|nr:hypothetical protein [Niallia taxi]